LRPGLEPDTSRDQMANCEGRLAEKPGDKELIGVIGLGLMGTAIAERLLAHGYRVAVWNRTAAKVARIIEQGAEWCENPLATCQRVIISLYTTDVVEHVLEQLEAGWRDGQIIVDTTTGEPAQTAALGRRLDERGVHYLNAPISGSSEQTRSGEATLIVGGARETFTTCADLWSVMGAKVFYVGSWESAAKIKLVINLVLGLNRAALAEGLAFAEAVGVEPATALGILGGSMAYSRVIDVKGLKMVQRDFNPQARLSQHLKDVRLMLEAAQDADLKLPLCNAHRMLLEQAEARGLGDLDNSAIIEVIRKPPPGSET
jgi:3-hydroxyisobutyrate dehydrogenase-like beta-hydroxyacid dehydrogenase